MRVALAVAFTTMCGDGAVEAQSRIAVPEVHHIHGLAVDRRNPGGQYVATHAGLVQARPNVAPAMGAR